MFGKSLKIVLGILLFLGSFSIKAFTANDDSLLIEVLLNKKLLADTYKDVVFLQNIEITPNNLFLLSSKDQFYLLGWGLINPICKKQNADINSYAYTSDNLLMVIRNDEVCTIDTSEKLTQLIKLPRTGMGISKGKYVMYIYDQKKKSSKYSLFVFAQGGAYKKLFDAPKAIQTVVEMDDSILFASENIVFSYLPKLNRLKTIAALPKDKLIKSIAVDTLNKRIYFATDSMICAIKDNATITITDQIGGVLSYFNHSLLVFNTEQKLLISIIGLETKIADAKIIKKHTKDGNARLITNENVINMVKEKLPDDFIIKIINKSEVEFDVSFDGMINLSTKNVSTEVIKAMKTAMKQKNNDNNDK